MAQLCADVSSPLCVQCPGEYLCARAVRFCAVTVAILCGPMCLAPMAARCGRCPLYTNTPHTFWTVMVTLGSWCLSCAPAHQACRVLEVVCGHVEVGTLPAVELLLLLDKVCVVQPMCRAQFGFLLGFVPLQQLLVLYPAVGAVFAGCMRRPPSLACWLCCWCCVAGVVRSVQQYDDAAVCMSEHALYGIVSGHHTA